MSRSGEAGGRLGRLSDPGQGIVEYGLILALAVVVCAVSLLFFGDQLSALLTFIASQV
jgi:Flp pilus assembly pilin Flp